MPTVAKRNERLRSFLSINLTGVAGRGSRCSGARPWHLETVCRRHRSDGPARSRKLPHKNYVNIWNLKELRGIEVSDDLVTLGALTTYTEVQDNAVMRAEFPMLCQAARETGGIAIQNRGTLGGNIVNASPAADSPPALLAYDAELELISKEGSRSVQYAGIPYRIQTDGHPAG